MVLVESMTWRKKNGEIGFCNHWWWWILLHIVSSHGELFKMMYDGIIVGDYFHRRIKEFEGGEELTVFWCDVYGAVWLSWAEFDVNGGGVSIILILYFYSVCYIAVIIMLIECIVGNIRNRHYVIFGRIIICNPRAHHYLISCN